MTNDRTPRFAVIATISVIVLIASIGSAPTCAAADAELHELFTERHEWEEREFPEWAMQRGDYTNAHRLTDHSFVAIERRHQETVDIARRLAEIDPTRLGDADRVSYALFQLSLSNAMNDHRFQDFLTPIGSRSGPHQDIPQMAVGVRFAQAIDYENYLRRLEAVPAWVDQIIALLGRGLEEDITPPKVALRGLPGQFDALLASGGLDALAEPFAEMPAHVPVGQQNAMRLRFERVARPGVLEALARLQSFVANEYLPGCRTAIAATTRPDGDAYYAYQLRKMTTTPLTAEEIHALGLAEVARIRAEMMEVIRRSDFMTLEPLSANASDDEIFAGFLEYLRTSPRFYYEDPEALLSGYRDICKQVDGWLPKFFGTLPRLPYGVRKIPDFMAPTQTTAYYNFGSLENGEPGWFYANTYALDQRPKYEMIALAMHEAVPGHHLQSAIAQELGDVPEFRRNMWFNAYGEGWALYSERLGLEMGLYEDPYDDFGRLLYEMWRACRLVVDPGIHALGWTRARAISYMRENTALSELNISTEVDRYIAWPGQACGYKIGELKIRELRALAEERLARQFDIRAFHDVVLGAGSIPLPVLEQRVRKWIRSQPGGAIYD